VVAVSTGTFYGVAMTAGDIYTVAGGGGSFADGVRATSAQLDVPRGVVVDGAGNLVIALLADGRVRVVAVSTGTFYGVAMTAGDIYTVAGNGTQGYSGDGGPASSASFNGVLQVALDREGNLVLDDFNNQRVRMVAVSTGTFYGVAMTAGDIYTVAGNGTQGYSGDGGPATSAELNEPEGVAVDGSDNLFIGDFGSSVVRQVVGGPTVSASGTTFNATEGASFSGTVASFSDPDTSALAGEYSAMIDWGDSTPTSSGTVSSGTAAGNFSVSGSHTYAEEGTYSRVKVTITDKDNAANSVTATSTATVSDAALTSTCAAPANSTQSFNSTTANFHDADPGGALSDYGATIDWGDNSSSSGTIATGTGTENYTVSGTHTYSSTGPFTIKTTINDQGTANTVVSCSTLVRVAPACTTTGLSPSVTATLGVGALPTGVVASNSRAYVANSLSNTVSVIDTTQNPPAVIDSIAVGAYPYGMALNADGSQLYVANYLASPGTLTIINTSNDMIQHVVEVGTRPDGVAFFNNSVYVANLASGTVSQVDPSSGTLVRTIPLPSGPSGAAAPSGLAATPATAGALNGTLYVDDARNGVTLQVTLPTTVAGSVGSGVHPAYLSTLCTTGFVASPGDNSVKVLNLATTPPTAVASIAVGAAPYGVVADGPANLVLATSSGANTVTAIDPATNTVIGSPVAVGHTPDAVAVSPDGATAFVTNEADNTLSVLHVALPARHLYWANLNAGTIVEANPDGSGAQTIATGQNEPTGVAVSSSHLYWANQTAGTIVEANLDGTSPQTIATGQNEPWGWR
jgi:YVTN family beta-propeller protein